jgi:mono/diheme cytochrome c family protein
LSVADQTTVVQNGRGLMPAFTSKLTEAEIATVVDYTRTRLH